MNIRKTLLCLTWSVSVIVSVGWLGLALWIDYPNMPDNAAEWTGAVFISFMIFAVVWIAYFSAQWALEAFRGRWLDQPNL